LRGILSRLTTEKPEKPEIMTFSSESDIASVPSWEDLVIQQHAHSKITTPGVLWENRDFDVILGIVDKRGRSRAEIQNTYAELYNLANRKFGCVIVNTTFQSLEAMIADRSDDETYFPGNILRKINFMLGESNFETNALQSISAQHADVIVVGAHIAHCGSNALKHTPSVASVVASVDKNPTSYPGSARFQPRLIKATRGKGPKFLDNPQIMNLKDMMQERFEAWKEAHGKDFPPSVILFYRDGLVFDHKHTRDSKIIETETAAIREAYHAIFGAKKVSLTYILVNKSTESPGYKDPPSIMPIVNFITDRDISTAKYMYRVFGNGMSLTKDALKQLASIPTLFMTWLLHLLTTSRQLI